MPKRSSPTKRRPAQAAPLSTHEIRTRLTAFAHQWQGGKDEKADAQTFTLRLLECYGLSEHHYLREGRVPKPDGATGYMDGFIPGKLIIEFKSLGKNLKKAAEQAFGYRFGLPPETQPTHILLCDFARFVLLDLARDTQTSWTLAELPRHADQLRFLIDDTASAIVEEREADRRAAYQLARLHQGLLNVNFTGRPLEIFLTRTLFCLFADDTGMFNQNGQFLRFLQGSRGDGDDLGPRLQKLFETLNKPEAKRQTNLDDAYANFPYVNGSLFAELSEVPGFDSPLRQTLLACAELDWKDISPAIFGAMFQGVLETDASSDTTPQHKANKAKRRDLGAHYTSERHILRAINPLFMDALRAEFKAAGNDKGKLEALLARLPSIHLFDPACGCGNFLVIAYRELRLLELQIIEKLYKPKSQRQTSLLELARYAKVSPDQLHGIEIEDSAAHIARVAILITDHQINEQSRHIGHPRPTIPLGKMPNIVCANALTTDWAGVIDPQRCTYIVGNPPFVGAKFMSDEQREQTRQAFCGIHNAGLLDLVAAWYVKAARYMQANPQVRAALVSTNSITQGEQVGVLWGWMLAQGVHLQFAHRTFQWNNEGAGVAAVHCVIVGFGLQDVPDKVIFTYDNIKSEPQAVAVNRINPYLVDAPNVVLPRRSRPICDVPGISKGNQPTDGGNLILSQAEKDEFLKEHPDAHKFIKRLIGAKEFLQGGERYCLWLVGVSPTVIRNYKFIYNRVEACRKWRQEEGVATDTIALASKPTLFRETRNPDRYVVVPSVSSERRAYIPFGFESSETIATNLCLVIEDSEKFHFGILSSTMHNAWVRATCGRMKSDYRYSKDIVYNNFPWPDLPVQPTTKTPARTTKAKAAIEAAAQAVLDARATYQQATPPASLADLYDPLTMPADLLQAHLQLDKAVDAAYGYKGGKDEASRVAFLFGRYSALTQSAAA